MVCSHDRAAQRSPTANRHVAGQCEKVLAESGDIVPAPTDLPDCEGDEPSPPDGTAGDDLDWDVFLADDDECDPLPEAGDFWIDEPRCDDVEN